MSDPVSYIPSDTFQGAKPGYVFGTRQDRTGYYLDNKFGKVLPPQDSSDDTIDDTTETIDPSVSPKRISILQKCLDPRYRKKVILWIGCAAAALVVLYLVYRWRCTR